MDLEHFNTDDYVAHYTTFDNAIKIIDSNKIKLSHKEMANDLHESNKNWFFDEAYYTNNRNHIEQCDNIKKQIENRINKHIQTFATIGYQENRKFFNRPRAWAQYGDNNNGICLIFDKNKLTTAFSENKQIIKLYNKKIDYIDWLQDINGMQTDYTNHEDITKLQILLDNPRLLYEEVNKNFSLQHRLFNKDIDWEHENEYRWLVFSEILENICIDYNDALKAIVLGANVNNRLKNCFGNDSIEKYCIVYDNFNKYDFLPIK